MALPGGYLRAVVIRVIDDADFSTATSTIASALGRRMGLSRGAETLSLCLEVGGILLFAGVVGALVAIAAARPVVKELDTLPDYRLTCFFVDKRYRRRGVSALALQGALDLIAKAGGGVVEAYPQDTGGKKITASFLYSVTRSLFEQAGFSYVRPKGKNHTVMRKAVKAAR